MIKKFKRIEQKMKRYSFLVGIIATYAFGVLFFSGCGKNGSTLFYGALGVGETRVIFSSSNGTSQSITMYDANGNFKGLLADYSVTGGTPRGFAYFNPICFLAAIEANDQIEKICLDGTAKTLWAKNAQVTGFNGLLHLPDTKRTLAIDTSTIELFDEEGIRIPPTGATPYIATTIGGCTLSTPTRMVLNADGELVVTNPGNERITVYNISAAAPTCVTSTDFSAFANDPQALLSHSDGNIYVVTIVNAQETLWRADSHGANATSLYANNTAILQDGNALAELPNGNILVSSFGTDSVVEFQTDGTLVRVFAKDSHTVDVYDIHIISGENTP